MKGNKLFIILSVLVIFVGTLVLSAYLLKKSAFNNMVKISQCTSDADCVLFGETGDCNCGCYLVSELPNNSGGECFCQAPIDCTCLNGRCEGVFEIQTEINNFEDCVNAGNPVMESYPRQCRTKDGEMYMEKLDTICNGMSLDEAQEIAQKDECGNRLKETHFCNNGTKTWWIDLEIEKEGCNPACVIDTESKEAEINWRCTGLVPQ